jgi:hypothetical protein
MICAPTASSLVRTPIPGGWHGCELARDPESWRVSLSGEVRDDLLRAAADLGSDGVSADPYQPLPRVSARTRSLVAELYRRLAGEPGVVMLTGFPVTEGPELTEAAYLLLAKLLGQPIMQMLDGSLLARVEADTANPGAAVPGVQGRVVPMTLPFHVDGGTDLVGLLCVRPARAGGMSRLVSCRAVHNMLLARHPDLLSALYQPVPLYVQPMRGPDGDQSPGWCEVPMFSQVGGHFAAYCSRRLVEGGQRFPDAPRLTQQVAAALDAVDEVTGKPGLPLEMTLQPGDLLLFNNLSLLHARTRTCGSGLRSSARISRRSSASRSRSRSRSSGRSSGATISPSTSETSPTWLLTDPKCPKQRNRHRWSR